MKKLTTRFAPDYVDLALGDTAVCRGLVTIEDSDTDKELPSLSRAVDFVARVSRDQEEALLLEFQPCWKADMPRRMAGPSAHPGNLFTGKGGESGSSKAYRSTQQPDRGSPAHLAKHPTALTG